MYPRYGYIDDRYNLNQWIPDTSDDGPWNEIEWIEVLFLIFNAYKSQTVHQLSRVMRKRAENKAAD